MDISDTVQPDSTQINADDLIAGSVVVTVTGVRRGTSEQPVNIDVAEFPGRAYRPSKSMRRVLVAAWGSDTSAYAGRKIALYRDPNVKFGRDTVGGIKIAALSHIDKPLTIALTVTRGKRAPYKVDPLPDRAPAAQPVDEATVAALAELREEWKTADPERQKQIAAEVQALTGGNQ